MSRLIINNGTLILRDRMVSGGAVVCENGKITEVLDRPAVPQEGDEVIDASGKYISPGFIDIHVHGGGGYDFMDGTVEAFTGAAEMHAKHGTTTMFPTTLTSTLPELFHAFDVYEEAKKVNDKGSRFMGLHLEGPYFSPYKAGAQDPRYLITPKPEDYNKIFDACPDIVRMDAAPEVEGALELGDEMTRRGIVASVAHTNALYEETMEAFKHGYTHMTHFYCAMSAASKRGPLRYAGAVEAGYMADDITVEIIADGIHVQKPLLQYCCKFKGYDNISLITDALRAAGMPDGEFKIGSLENGQLCIKQGGVGMLRDGSALAGSVATTDMLVRTMVNVAEAPLLKAVQMASYNPAKVMRVDDKVGSLEVGKYADVLVFNDNIDIDATIIGGKVIYRAE